ncbi:hypothetical protein GGX14DRAFT_645057 [Mycena pura]|uniref:Uncharacterized protein n=1 Tax=Mycena pura TaxID=153505 RepID=A0AAD6V8I0_9AGAR|nr:hypothetical protein GGX14DRAFT_645057 [Mycena pura]
MFSKRWSKETETRSAADIRYVANSARRPILSTATSEKLRNILNTRTWDIPGKWENMSKLARDVVESQIEAHEAYIAARVKAVPSLVDVTAIELPERPSLSDIANLPSEIRSRVSYPSFRRMLSLASESQERPAKRQKGVKETVSEVDVDEWILVYERYLSDTRHFPTEWKHGLVSLEDANDAFPDSALSNNGRLITRPQTLSGHLVLGEERAPSIRIQSSVAAFRHRFDELTGNVLKDLDWSNLLVAGGIVLGALLVGDSPDSSKQWESSDIDVYVYGLGPQAATEKIKHIFQVFRANLPRGAPTLVVRNSKTITFYSDFPTRRIQIVLKLVKSPKDVLLNFDLDICAIGWDGSNVWMLPRAARALETGFNVFTMNLIQGHYLSERRATQEQRVFKYANRGYGIRILPSYVTSLVESQANIDSIARGERLVKLDMDTIAETARNFTKNAPCSSHKALDQGGDQVSTEPQGRSCLSGFSVFMRHVALWEMERRGEVKLRDQEWAATTYSDEFGNLSYDDTPRYAWDEHFNLKAFTSHIDRFNADQITNWLDSSGRYDNDGQLGDVKVGYSGHSILPPPGLKNAQRISYAPEAEGVLCAAKDVRMPVLLPANFAAFANDLVRKALADAGLPVEPILAPVNAAPEARAPADAQDATLRLFIWCIPTALLWQQLDRRIDEVAEALYAFYRIHDRFSRKGGDRMTQLRLVTQLSKRAITTEVEDEYAAFARWIGRKPIFIQWTEDQDEDYDARLEDWASDGDKAEMEDSDDEESD